MAGEPTPRRKKGAEFLIVSPIDWLRIWGDNVGLGFGIDVEVIPSI